ncbi:phage tail protein [Janthinobacterium sp. SUN118]|uniref:phage tail protein n=1 Tax=Janthinobacterium sp. SUN118 TaxID=3004100 RepID=UPI0025AF5116|nr:phage tail protein [Janthinobacterium sp. SUN118]MDN2709786.1 phage tail protein [Janthinobacterium sp. SUN118]
MSAASPVPSPFYTPPGFGDTPVGAVIAFAGTIADTSIEAWGWMVCDGRLLGVSQYPELFATLGYLYGGANDTFRLPDYRGCFLRGRAAGTDTDAGQGAGPVRQEAGPNSADVSYLIKFTSGMRMRMPPPLSA